MAAKKHTPTISAAELTAFTGYTDRRHRQLADEGYFPKPADGRYERDATHAGLYRFFREMLAKKDNTLEKKRVEQLTKKNKILDQTEELNELNLGERKGDLRSSKQLADALFQLYQETKSILWQRVVDQLPSIVVGMDVESTREIAKGVVNDILNKHQEFAKTWNP